MCHSLGRILETHRTQEPRFHQSEARIRHLANRVTRFVRRLIPCKKTSTMPIEISSIELQVLHTASNQALIQVPMLESMDYVKQNNHAFSKQILLSLPWAQKLEWQNKELDQMQGVFIDEHGSVIELFLENKGLTGPIPPEIGQLTELQSLMLTNNNLTGLIPNELGNCKKLTTLCIQKSSIQTTLPPTLKYKMDLALLT